MALRFINSLFVQDGSNIFAENRLLKIGFVAVVLWSTLLTVQLQKATGEKQEKIIPFCGPATYELSGVEADQAYLRDMARLIIHLVGDITPANAKQQFSEVLPHVHVSTYTKYQNLFKEIATELERFPNISYRVSWNGDKAMEIEGNVIRVKASKVRMVGTEAKPPETITYEIVFKFEYGRFKIIDINEVVQNA